MYSIFSGVESEDDNIVRLPLQYLQRQDKPILGTESFSVSPQTQLTSTTVGYIPGTWLIKSVSKYGAELPKTLQPKIIKLKICFQ